jgi:hypothetical protein
MDNGKPYIMSFTSGGLCLHESLILARTFLGLGDWQLARKHVIDKNLLQARMSSSAKRTIGEVIPRLQKLSNDELLYFISAGEQDQKHLLWLAICRRHRFIADFMVEVVHDRYVSLKEEVGTEEFYLFWTQKSVSHPEIERISDLTREKLRTVLFKMLREVGIISGDGRINTVILSPPVQGFLNPSNPEERLWFTTFDAHGRRS